MSTTLARYAQNQHFGTENDHNYLHFLGFQNKHHARVLGPKDASGALRGGLGTAWGGKLPGASDVVRKFTNKNAHGSAIVRKFT